MNIKQKKMVLTFLIVLVLSAIFVPTEMNLIVSGEGGFKPKTLFQWTAVNLGPLLERVFLY